jgi:uncharacterized protein (DUF58 family)
MAAPTRRWASAAPSRPAGPAVTPSPRAAAALAAIALAALVVPVGLAALLAVALAVAVAADALAARLAPAVERDLPAVLSRGVPARLRVRAAGPPGGGVRVRQPAVPGVLIEPAQADDGLEATLTGRRRGRHRLPAVAVRARGPLGLARWDHAAEGTTELRVYPDMRTARSLARSVARGRFRDPGLVARGPLGLGTEFELVRDYQPDDDIRQVNWRATARMGRPMSNQYRLEQDRDVVLALDAGRLSTAPLAADLTVLDVTLDAACAVGLVADVLGDRCGAVAFDSRLRAALRPRRAGGAALVRALFDLEPAPVESDYELAFRHVETGKRALVFVLVDLLEETAARPLAAAVPLLARHHAVVVASPADPALKAAVAEGGARARVAASVLDARARAAARVRAGGATVLEAPPDRLPAACVAAYLRAKSRARL